MLIVKKGWHGPAEINRVRYDPQQVDRQQLEEWLKESHTYIRTLPERLQE